LIRLNGGDATAERAVILSVVGFPEQLVAATRHRLDFCDRNKPRFKEPIDGKQLEGMVRVALQMNGQMNDLVHIRASNRIGTLASILV
jgi:hypothetical protein